MKKTIVFAIVSMAFILVGCSEEKADPFRGGEMEIEFTSYIDHRASRAAIDEFTVTQDRIGIYKLPASEADFDNAYRANVPYIYRGDDVFAPVDNSQAMYWMDEPVDFVAYYPYREGAQAEHIYPVDVTDQIDLLYAKATNRTADSNGGAVDFVFRHKLSKLNFIVTDADDTVSLESITTVIRGLDCAAEFDLQTEELTPTPDSDADIAATLDSAAANVAYINAIVLPTDGEAVDFEILFTLSNGHTATLHMTDRIYAPGKEYTYAVTLEQDEEPVAVVVDSSIADWEDGGTETLSPIEKDPISTGEPQEPTWRVVFNEDFADMSGDMGNATMYTGPFSDHFIDSTNEDYVFVMDGGIRIGALNDARIASIPLGSAGTVRVTIAGQGWKETSEGGIMVDSISKTLKFDTFGTEEWTPSSCTPFEFTNVPTTATLQISTTNSNRLFIDNILVEVMDDVEDR